MTELATIPAMPSEPGEAHQLAAIVRSVTEAIVATDPAGTLTLLNPAGARVFGRRAEAVLGQPLSSLHPDLGRWLERARAEAAHAAGVSEPLVFSLEVPAGRVFSATLAPVQADTGALAGWVIVLQDSTQTKQAEEWKAEAIQSATHDLRNPINLMNGALNLLRDSLKDLTPEQRECLVMLRSGLDRMSGLVEQVLNLDQVAGRSDLALVKVTLSVLARQVVEELRLLADEKEITLSFTASEPAGQVLGDDGWLHRAITNLAGNAVKYTPRGGQIWVRYHETDGHAICEVADNGPGIPAAAQARLFERFYRVPGETTRRTTGTGLGLAIVKAIVERHSGRVWVSSQEGQGSTFGFSVPLAQPAAPKLPPPQPPLG